MGGTPNVGPKAIPDLSKWSGSTTRSASHLLVNHLQIKTVDNVTEHAACTGRRRFVQEFQRHKTSCRVRERDDLVTSWTLTQTDFGLNPRQIQCKHVCISS